MRRSLFALRCGWWYNEVLDRWRSDFHLGGGIGRLTRKRWIILGIVWVAVCLLVVGFGALFLAKNIPGVARLVYGDPSTPTPRERVTVPLPTVTLTPTSEPTREPPTPTTAPPSPTASDGEPTVEPTVYPVITASSTVTPALPTATFPPPTSTPRPPQWIVFEPKRGELGEYEIFAMAPDGSQVSNLTSSWADDLAPAWSPDGKRIVFVSYRDTLAGKWGLGNGSIYIMDFDPLTGTGGGNVTRLTDDEGSEGWPTWSPDGKRIAFQSDRSGNWDIWIINTDGTGLRNLTNHPQADRYADWSPDGRKIAFTSKRSGNEDIWVVNVDGSKPVKLTKAGERDRYPFWSPDGQKLTFNTNRDGNFEVYAMNADGSSPRNVSQTPKSEEGLADWSPDGKYLVLYSDRTGNKEVFVLDLASSRWTNITNNPASDEFCSWSP
jgi:Tol biopolymer transport system component